MPVGSNLEHMQEKKLNLRPNNRDDLHGVPQTQFCHFPKDLSFEAVGKSRRLLRASIFAGLTALLAACSTISTYDQTAYLQDVNTKVDALTLMGKATAPYVDHQNDVAVFQIELQKAYEYERGRPLNKTTLEQWDVLLDPNGDLLAAFLKEWKESGKLLPVYIKRKQDQIGKGFDKIIQLESGKIKTASG
jgi:hypothetical protein